MSRYLRIAFSATCLIACVLLCVLWVRSYWTTDSLTWNHDGGRVVVFSGHGQIRVSTSNITFASAPLLRWHTGEMMPDGIGSWFFQSHRQGVFVVFPHRLAIAILATFAGISWIEKLKWRFSLRTLLIATTLVAVVLGLIVWAVK